MNNRPPGVQIPLLGQQQQAANQAIMQAVNQLSIGIYSHLATAHISGRDEHQAVDPDKLRQLAKDSQVAAKAYFEGLGVAQFPHNSKE